MSLIVSMGHSLPTKGSNDMICPNGENLPFTQDEKDNGLILKNPFEKHCQTDATCPWNTLDERYYCGNRGWPVDLEPYLVKDACIIHDMCYESGRSKQHCDEEFYHNFKKLCVETPYVPLPCGDAADAVCYAVMYFGKVSPKRTCEEE